MADMTEGSVKRLNRNMFSVPITIATADTAVCWCQHYIS
jgi:hypothetical protein